MGIVPMYGLNYKDKAENARRFLGRYGNPFDAVGVDETGRVGIDWGVYGVPETFIVDRAGRMPNLSGQILTFVREALRDPDADSPVAAFLVQAAMDAHHVPAAGGQAATLVEGFIRGAVGSAARRGEVGADPDGLTDMLLGLVWGTAFQLARGDVRSADRMLEQLCAVLGSGPER